MYILSFFQIIKDFFIKISLIINLFSKAPIRIIHYLIFHSIHSTILSHLILIIVIKPLNIFFVNHHLFHVL